jgi:hypothetical protein
MSGMWGLLAIPFLFAYWVWMCREAKTAMRARARVEIAFRAIDRASAAFRRMGIQAEIAGRRIEEFERAYRDEPRADG